MEKENRNVKNSMFVDLFYEDESAEENDIALYNALHEEPLPVGTKIQKIRIDDVLYIGRAYEKIVPIRDRYKKKRVALPKPEFYTFYNGKEPWAKEKKMLTNAQ